jgi:UDP-2,3-diacylglucosamine hydrolase
MRQIIKRVVLLGDIFDFNLGYQRTVFRAHLPFLFCLERLKRAGVEIIIFTGNHDPDPSPVVCDDLSIYVSTQPLSVEIYGELVLLEHGDLLEPNWFKRLLCRGARHPWIRSIARLIPPAISWDITQRWGAQTYDPHANDSESDSEGDSEGDSDTLEATFKAHWSRLYNQGYQYWVFGHFHQARCWRPHQLADKLSHQEHMSSQDSKVFTVFVLGDQVQLNTCLYWDEHGPLLCALSISKADHDEMLNFNVIDHAV